MLAFLQLLVVGWLPGAVLFRLPLAERDRRAALPAEERAYWAVVLSVAMSISLRRWRWRRSIATASSGC